MADGLEEVESSLTKDVGGIPVWVLGAGLGVAIAVAIWLYRKSEGSNVVAHVYDPSSDSSSDENSDPTNADYGLPNGPAGDWLADNPGSTAFPVGGAALPSPITNGQWARQVIDGLLALGDDPSLVNNAITKYVNGQGLSAAEKAIVNIALQKYGSTPEGSIPVLDAPASSGGTTTTNPPVVDPALPVIRNVHATNVGRNGATIAWDVIGKPTTQVVYRNSSPYAVLGPGAHSYTFSRLSPGTQYRFGVVPQRGVKTGKRADVVVRTKS